jgi:hypothetical protein
MKNNFFPLQFAILGYLLIGFGIYFLIRNDWVGFIMIPVGMVFSFLIINQKFDLENKKYIEYYGFLGLKFGKWKGIPGIDYVTVFLERSVQGKNLVSISSYHVEKNFKIDLIISKTERIDAGRKKDRDTALERGKELAGALDKKLLDYTSGEPVWVELQKKETK